MLKSTAPIDYLLLVVGSAYSLANIEEVLGIIILVIQLSWIVAKLVFKIIEAIKQKKIPHDIGDDVKDTIDAIEDIRDVLNPEDGDSENEYNDTEQK